MAREWLAVAQVCDVRKSRDAIPKEDQSAEGSRLVVIVCTQCQAKIEPSQIQRVRWDTVKCPYCGAVFVPQSKERAGMIGRTVLGNRSQARTVRICLRHLADCTSQF